MEAIEERIGLNKDSFDEIDRVLKIAEQYNSEYNKLRLQSQYVYYGFILLTIALSIAFTYTIYQPIGQENLFLLVITIGFTGIMMGFIANRFLFLPYKKRINQCQRVVDQAVEIIRETYPIVAYAEQWSKLREFELRLRLSQLGIAETTQTNIFAGTDQKKPMFSK